MKKKETSLIRKRGHEVLRKFKFDVHRAEETLKDIRRLRNRLVSKGQDDPIEKKPVGKDFLEELEIYAHSINQLLNRIGLAIYEIAKEFYFD